MKRHSLMKFTVAFLIFILTFGNIGCTKEKAEAIKNGATQFRVEAKSSIEVIRTLFHQSVPLTLPTSDTEVKDIVKEFKTVPSTGDIGDFVARRLDGARGLEASFKPIETELGKIEGAYELLGSMYDSLPRGHFFASKEVEKSKRVVAKLTLLMLQFAKSIDKDPFPFDARRQTLRQKFRLAKSQETSDPDAAKETSLLAAQELIQLRADEAKANQEAIAQCLKAVQAGKLLSELIENYKSFSVSDILDLTKNGLSLIRDISGGNSNITAAMGRLEAFSNNKILTDPLWKDVWNTEVNNPALFQ